MASDTRPGNSRRQQELTRLLCRGLSRLAVAAQGSDQRLDMLLSELRQILRGDMADLERFATVVDGIEERIRQVDVERDHSADLLRQALELLIAQLQQLQGGQSRALRQFAEVIGDRLRAPGALLRDYAALQGQILDTVAPRESFWRRLLPARNSAHPALEAPNGAPAVPEVVTPADPVQAPRDEPSLSAVSDAAAELLSELLRQMEPPAGAVEAYQQARAQLAAGLSWYELVPTLEQVSLVVLAALEQDRGQFQHFLLQLNQKLADVHQVLALSQEQQEQRASADTRLDEAVRSHVAAIQGQVFAATDLSHLKQEVTGRLDAIVGAMDQHQYGEQARHAAMQQQLDQLAQRVREMEDNAAQVEQRMVEQRRLALLDGLTQLPNRQAYEERLQQEFERWQRYGRPLVIAVCDIDNFKSINDGFGHLAGDKVLRILARTLRSRLRKTDFIARYGGEEFVLLLPETGADEALAVLDAVRVAVSDCPFHFRDQPVAITLSAGVAGFAAGDNPDAAFERADAALYRAKQAGRNRCLLAQA